MWSIFRDYLHWFSQLTMDNASQMFHNTWTHTNSRIWVVFVLNVNSTHPIRSNCLDSSPLCHRLVFVRLITSITWTLSVRSSWLENLWSLNCVKWRLWLQWFDTELSPRPVGGLSRVATRPGDKLPLHSHPSNITHATKRNQKSTSQIHVPFSLIFPSTCANPTCNKVEISAKICWKWLSPLCNSLLIRKQEMRMFKVTQLTASGGTDSPHVLLFTFLHWHDWNPPFGIDNGTCVLIMVHTYSHQNGSLG